MINLAILFGTYPQCAPAHEDIKEEIEQPLDIRAPGSDLANFPNSAFTLPSGGFYLETSPVSYSGRSSTLVPEYNWEYLLRYGLFDWLELRLYSPGFSVQGSPESAVGFSPLTFDTKLHFWNEFEAYHLPAAAFEFELETEVLGSTAFNSGLEPAFSINFDQALPWDVQIEYNLGAARFIEVNNTTTKQWDITFAWAIQREVVKDLALFLNGYYQAADLPRVGKLTGGGTSALGRVSGQNALGLGGLWTINDHLAMFTNLAAGTTAVTPNFIGYVGFAWTP